MVRTPRLSVGAIGTVDMNSKYYVYILRSKADGRYYIGQTSDIIKRIEAHNRGSVRSTKDRRPIDLVYLKSLDSRTQAIKEETLIKNYKDTDKYLNNLAIRMAPSSNGWTPRLSVGAIGTLNIKGHRKVPVNSSDTHGPIV